MGELATERMPYHAPRRDYHLTRPYACSGFPRKGALGARQPTIPCLRPDTGAINATPPHLGPGNDLLAPYMLPRAAM